MKKIYLDVCSLCRPFDDQSFARIRLETEAVNIIISNVRSKYYELIKSPVHMQEIQVIEDDFERIELIKLLNAYGTVTNFDLVKIRNRTENLLIKNIGLADAAHLAFAEFCNAEFISCDDKLLKKINKLSFKVKCFNPVTFCEMENLR